jgi:signal transduction histidine kinase
LLLPVLIATVTVFGQDAAINSVLAEKDDSAKVIKLANLAYSYIDVDTAKAQKLYDELMRISTKLQYSYWIGMVWINRGFMNARVARDETAIQNYYTALHYLSKTDRIDMIAICHLNIGNISERLGKVEAKVEHLSEAIRLLQNTKYTTLMNHAYNALGVLFLNQGDFTRSINDFQKAAASSKEAKDTSNLVEALHGIINCLSSEGHFDDADVYGKKIIAVATASNKYMDLLHAHNALSEMYCKWGKAPLAIEHAKKLLNYAQAAGEVQYQIIGLMNLADGYALAKDYKNSIMNYNRALQLGQEKSADLQLDDIYKGLSGAYEKLNQPSKALDLYKKYIIYRDSASNEKIKKNSAELDVKYQTADRERKLSEGRLQLAERDLQLQKNRIYLYYILLAFVAVLVFASLLFIRSQHKKRLHKEELKAVQQQNEIQLLHALMQGEEKERSRIAKDLHDGVAGMLAAVKMHFSSIQSPNEISETEGYRQGMKLLNEATQEIRKTSHNLMPEVLLQHGLDEAISRFCANVNNSRGLHIQYDSWGKIDRFGDSFELSVYRIVQELVNNVLKHSKASQAIVQMSQQGDLLTISIEDNGIGLSDENKDGMGLKSLQSRIRAMNGKLEIESSKLNGLSAYLEFDVADLKKETVLA